MERYEGISSGDHITGGGAFVKKNGRGYEVCNFAPDKNSLYGYVQTPGIQINIDRIGRRNTINEYKYINGVTVVWTAKRPRGRTVIVGWYRDATVFREYQKFGNNAPAPEAQSKNDINGYWIKAPFDKATLLSFDERIFEIPRKKGFMGQSNVWYADSEESAPLVKKIRDLIHGGTFHIRKQKHGKAQDQEKKVEVEKAAIRACCTHFESLGYDVASVERDNVGWDLVATAGRYSLRIEVKGLSGTVFSIELTPNEYNAFTQQASDYRLAVVVDALARNPLLSICRYSDEQGAWVVEGAEKGRVLEVRTKQSASIRCI